MIFITGATGFVGRNLLRKLIGKGVKVRCLVRDRSRIDNNNEVETIQGDIADIDILNRATQDVDIVIHLAAIAKTSSPDEFINVNVKGTKNLVDACIKNKVKKIIYVSSLDAALSDTNLYGRTKRMGEDVIKNSKIDYIILRPALIYGKDSKDINMLTGMVKKSSLIPVVGNGRGRLQPVYVDNVCEIILKLIDSNIKDKIYYIAGEEKVSMNDLIDKIANLYSKKTFKIHIPLWLLWLPLKGYNLIIKKSSISYDSLRLLNQDKTCDVSETKKDLNFNPIGLDEGLRLVLQN